MKPGLAGRYHDEKIPPSINYTLVQYRGYAVGGIRRGVSSQLAKFPNRKLEAYATLATREAASVASKTFRTCGM